MWVALTPTREEPVLLGRDFVRLSGRMLGTPPTAQHFQQAGGEHGVTILLAFPLPHPDEHAFRIDIANS
jgi:hypothetical protein